MTINKNWYRNIHRDIAYFYIGLIIAFSISGIALNHRTDFNPQQYTVSTENIQLDMPDNATEAYFKSAVQPFVEDETYRSFRVSGNEARLYYKDARASIDLETGKGEIEFIKTRLALGQMTILHKSTNKWWTWFSDIFGVAMLTIAVTGMFIAKGKYSFKRRGWILAVIGLIFPFIFLFLIN